MNDNNIIVEKEFKIHGITYEFGAYFKYKDLFKRLLDLMTVLPNDRIDNKEIYFQTEQNSKNINQNILFNLRNQKNKIIKNIKSLFESLSNHPISIENNNKTISYPLKNNLIIRNLNNNNNKNKSLRKYFSLKKRNDNNKIYENKDNKENIKTVDNIFPNYHSLYHSTSKIPKNKIKIIKLKKDISKNNSKNYLPFLKTENSINNNNNNFLFENNTLNEKRIFNKLIESKINLKRNNLHSNNINSIKILTKDDINYKNIKDIYLNPIIYNHFFFGNIQNESHKKSFNKSIRYDEEKNIILNPKKYFVNFFPGKKIKNKNFIFKSTSKLRKKIQNNKNDFKVIK